MFISKKEKTEINEALEKADYVIDELIEIVRGINERLGKIEAMIKNYPKEFEERALYKKQKQREYARRHHEKKKAEKKAAAEQMSRLRQSLEQPK